MRGKTGLAIAAALAAGCSPYVSARLGMTSPVSQKEQTIESSLEGSVEFGARNGRNRYCVAVGYYESHAEDPPATIDTPTVAVSAMFLRQLTEGRAKVYVGGELVNLAESPHIQIGPPFNVDDYPGTEHTQGLGVVVGAEIGRADARLVYRRLLGSENVEGAVDASVGFRF